MSKHLYFSSHCFEPHWIIEQPVDFVGQRREIVTADRNSLFQQVVGVTLFLARDGIYNDEDHALRVLQRL